ncbi:MAG: hypothetical protein K6F99_03755 [Lachnospiraceae bacterium]|nr:hypothetical protein [Lachnospiraceae bacterium]
MNGLKNIFDYQKFEHNKELDNVIKETEERFGISEKLITDEELDMVAGGAMEQSNSSGDQGKYPGTRKPSGPVSVL